MQSCLLRMLSGRKAVGWEVMSYCQHGVEMQLTWGFVCLCVWFFGFCCFWKDYLKWIPYSSLPSPSGFPPSLPLSFLSVPIFLPFSFVSFSFFFLFLHDCFSIKLFLIFVSSLHFPSKSILLLFLNLSPLSLRNFFFFPFFTCCGPCTLPKGYEWAPQRLSYQC